MCRVWTGMEGRKRGREFQAGPVERVPGGMRRPDDGSVQIERQYSLTTTQKVRAPIGWPLMPWCDHSKGVGRLLVMWRLSVRACGSRARRSLTGGKEPLCPALEKRWQGWSGYEIGGWRDGTSQTSSANLARWVQSSLASASA